MLVLLVANRSWALYSLCKDLERHVSDTFEPIHIITENDFLFRPIWSVRTMQSADALVWVDTHFNYRYGEAFRHSRQVSWIHHMSPSETWKAKVAKAAERCITNSRLEAEKIAGLGVRYPDVLPHGVDTKHFAPRDVCRAREALDLPDHVETWIGTFGRPYYGPDDRKGLGFLHDVLREAKHSEADLPGLLLVGERWSEFGDACAELGIPVAIRENLPADCMPLAYSALDVYLCVSSVEGGPLPILEALSCGVPVVSRHVGIAADVITEPAAGTVLDLNTTPGEFYGAVQRHLDTCRSDPRQASRIRSGVVADRDWQAVGPIWARHFLSLLSEASRPLEIRPTSFVAKSFAGHALRVRKKIRAFARGTLGWSR